MSTMYTQSDTPGNAIMDEAIEVADALNEAVRDALEPFADQVNTMWKSVEAERMEDGYLASAAEAYRQYLFEDIQPIVLGIFSAAGAPLVIDNSRYEEVFTIYHKRHVGVPAGSRTGIFGGPEEGDFETILSNIEETVEEACADFKDTYI